MLEHQKLLLANLQNFPELFTKELQKSLRWLTPEELNELKQWLVENFEGSVHWDTIQKFCNYHDQMVM